MKEKVIYKEVQRYGSEPSLVAAIPVLGAVFIWYMEKLEPEMTTLGLFLILGFMVLLAIALFALFKSMRMILRIKEKQIELQYFPFRRKPIVFKKNEIKEWRVRSYSAIKEFGGTGYKKQNPLKNTGQLSYTLKGKQGLDLSMKGGKRYLIGTQRRQILEYELRKWMEER